MGRRNPLKWDCTKDGCYLKKCKVKLEDFSTNLKDKCSFTDIDGMTEHNHNFLMMEWKTLKEGEEPEEPVLPNGRKFKFNPASSIPQGQHLAYMRAAASGKFVTLGIAGDPSTTPTTVTHCGWYIAGVWTGWRSTNLAKVNNSFGKWKEWADGHYGSRSAFIRMSVPEIRRSEANKLLALADQIERLVPIQAQFLRRLAEGIEYLAQELTVPDQAGLKKILGLDEEK